MKIEGYAQQNAADEMRTAKRLLERCLDQLDCCANTPACDDEDEPMPWTDWCFDCRLSKDIETFLGAS
jgi:hypothetical protein